MKLQALTQKLLQRRAGTTSFLGRFWRWWRDEILYFVPPKLRAALDKEERVLRVALRDGELLLDYRHGDEQESIGRISTVNDAGEEALPARMPDTDRVVLELTPAYAARRQVSMPFGTEDRLDEVLGYEMDRLTPYAATDVYFDYRMAGRNAKRRVVEIDLVIALRQTVDDLLARLAAVDVRPTQVTLAGAPPATNLLPREQRKPAGARLPLVPAMLTGIAVLLAGIAIAAPLVHQRVELGRLEAEVSELRPAALAADQIRAEIDAATRQGNFFQARWEQSPTKISLLNELAAVIPDDTWLTRLQIDASVVRIHGESESASSLIGLLEDSGMFVDAHFSSPVTKHPRTSNDRFVIEARVVREEAGQ